MSSKLEKLAIFITYIVIILFGLSVAAFIFKELFSYKYITELSKNHKSLIAGLIGFGGVIWLIYNQNKETHKILESNASVGRIESFELKKVRAMDSFFLLEEQFEITKGILLGPRPYAKDFQPPIKDAIKKPIRYVRYFLGNDCSLSLVYLDALESYFGYALSQNRNRSYERWLLHILKVIHENPMYKYSDKDVNVFIPYDLKDPKDVIKNRDNISIDQAMLYIFDYMEWIIMRDIERIIKEKTFKK